MQSMQSFKTNQKLGSLTSSVLQELSTVRVEGRSEDGKIRVFMNGQQYPLAVQVGDDIDLTTINTALTQAMQDAHSKSFSLMLWCIWRLKPGCAILSTTLKSMCATILSVSSIYWSGCGTGHRAGLYTRRRPVCTARRWYRDLLWIGLDFFKTCLLALTRI